MPNVIGRVLRLNRGRYEVIGIAPAGFTGAELDPVDVWLPLRASAYAESGNDAGFDDRGMCWLQAVGAAEGRRITGCRRGSAVDDRAHRGDARL